MADDRIVKKTYGSMVEGTRGCPQKRTSVVSEVLKAGSVTRGCQSNDCRWRAAPHLPLLADSLVI